MILVFGTVCLDRILNVPYLPQPGGYVEIESERLFLGGEAANTATALRSWGAEVQLVGNPQGQDAQAKLLGEILAEKGIRNLTDELAPPTRDTPVCDIYVTPDGERTMFGRGFSTLQFPLPAESLPYVADRWFTAEPNMSAVAREVVREAHRRGMRVYTMDFFREGDPIEPGSVWQSSTDWIGFRGDIQKNVVWVQEWIRRHGCFAILSDGPNGFVAGGPGHPVRHFPPFPAPKVVDTTGAGDMLRAGVLLKLNQGEPVEEALMFGSAAGSLKCGTLGATESVPTVEAINNHIRMHPEVARQFKSP